MEELKIEKGDFIKIFQEVAARGKTQSIGRHVKVVDIKKKTKEILVAVKHADTSHNIVELVWIAFDNVKRIITKTESLWEDLREFFTKIPYTIKDEKGKLLHYTERPKKANGLDIVSFEILNTLKNNAIIGSIVVFSAQGETLVEAKSKMKEILKEKNYL